MNEPIEARSGSRPVTLRIVPAHDACEAPRSEEDRGRLAEVETGLRLVRPAMEADGGGVDVAFVHNGVVGVRFKGTCLNCPSIDLTLKLGLERTLRERLPWVHAVQRVE